MRFAFLLIGILLPQFLHAQFNSFKSGSYVLAASRNTRHAADIKLKGSLAMVVKDANGKTTKFTTDEVESFRIGDKKYTTAEEFDVQVGIANTTVDKAFVEQIDSGQVVLMRYEYSVGSPGVMGAGGSMSYGGSTSNSIYLLRLAKAYTVTPIPANWLTGGGKKFREALMPYLTARPDLTNLVENKLISDNELPNLIHALNSGQPYVQTSRSN